MDALGMLEVFGFTTSVVCADAVAKAGDVKIVSIDRNKPANAEKEEVPLLMTVKFTGNVAAVEAGMEAGVKLAEDRGMLVTHKIISSMGEGTEKMAAINALGRDKLRNYITEV